MNKSTSSIDVSGAVSQDMARQMLFYLFDLLPSDGGNETMLCLYLERKGYLQNLFMVHKLDSGLTSAHVVMNEIGARKVSERKYDGNDTRSVVRKVLSEFISNGLRWNGIQKIELIQRAKTLQVWRANQSLLLRK